MTSVALSQARVLVVDDFQGMRTILRDLVRSMGVSRVDTAANGKEALNQLRTSRYDVIICDFNLGQGLNGQQVLDEARLYDYVGVSTIWVMVTAEKTAEMIMGAAEAKPDEYLLKPINQNILETRLERLIVKKQALRGVEEALRALDWQTALARCNQLLAQEATKTPEVLRLKSEVLLKQGDWAAAKALFEGVLAQRSLPWARTGLGRVYYARGEYELARSQFRKVLDENRMFIEAADWLAKTLDAMGDKVQAQAVLQDAVKLSPHSASRQKTLGDVAWHNGALDVARGALSKTIKISEYSSNKQAGAYVALARVLSQDNEPEMALQLLKRTGDVFKESKEGAAVAIQVAAVQSAVYQQTGQPEQAQAAMLQAQQLLQLQGGAASAQTALEVAHGLLALGRKDEACDMMRTLVKSHHEDARVSGQVQALFEQAQMGEEGRHLIAQSREEAVAVNNEGVLLGRQGQFAEGAKLLRRALDGLPASEVLMMNLCGLLIGQMRAEGKSDTLMLEVLGLLERVRDINPDNAKYRQYLALLKTRG